MSDTPNLPAAGGKIMLVGLGPGSHAHLTARARAASAEADTVIGYVTTSAWWPRWSRARKSSRNP